jgi:hypothetical protein
LKYCMRYEIIQRSNQRNLTNKSGKKLLLLDSQEDHISTNIKVHWNNKHFTHLVLSAMVG